MPPAADQPHAIPATARRTVAQAAAIEGLGLFTGRPVRATIRPITDLPTPLPNPLPNPLRGIIFRRTDLGGQPTVAATIENVVSEQRRTVLQARAADGSLLPARVETVEHLLSALAGLRVTDALIDLDGPEVPILDGSAEPLVDAIVRAGLRDLPDAAPSVLVIPRPMTVGERGGQIDVLPPEPTAVAQGCEYVYRLDYGPNSPIPAHEARFFLPVDVAPDAYRSNIAPARTFSTLEEATAMRKMGLFTQFTPRDLLVIGPEGPIDNALRFPDEPARHKVLDMIGDLSLCGRRIVGRIIAARSGHALNHELARALASLALP